jgi:4-hydroxyproline epimerase
VRTGNGARKTTRISAVQRVTIIDSHTEGEPTRLVTAGLPELPGETLAEKAKSLREDHAPFMRGAITEPRGFEAIVGALLLPPHSPQAHHGLIFFNNLSTLRMCGHGTIGAAASLAQAGLAEPGEIIFDTPEGLVPARVEADLATVTIQNVPSHMAQEGLEVDVPGFGRIRGDLAWGGNWFFLAPSPTALNLSQLSTLTAYSDALKRALWEMNAGGLKPGELDHIELIGPGSAGTSGRNFVLCPGGEYDRSPCGTGTSAKLACLAAKGQLKPGDIWVQESVTGSRFEAWYEEGEDGAIHPFIKGRAFITLRGELEFHPDDPLRHGFHA